MLELNKPLVSTARVCWLGEGMEEWDMMEAVANYGQFIHYWQTISSIDYENKTMLFLSKWG